VPRQLTLPGKYYTDPDIYRREIERFYFGSWISVGRTEQLAKPGDYFLRNLEGESIIVTRDAANQVRAFFNVCRHRGTRMCSQEEGAFPGRITCPYHGWSYGLDGVLLGAPHMEVDGFSRADYPLHGIPVEIWDGHIFLNLSANPRPLGDQLGPLPARFANWRMQDLRLVRRIVYDVKANWKLIVLNYNECLHCPLVHPTLNQFTDYLGADNDPPSDTYIGGCMGFSRGAETMSMDGVRRRDYLPALDEEQRKLVAYYAIYPNFLLSLHPDYMMVHTLWPRAVDRTEVVCEWHFHPDEIAKPGFQSADAIDLWDMTNREDWAIAALSQAGVSSRAYTPGPYSHRESLLHAFDRIMVEGEK
jgi:Rieske 2Fe-2S family protein